MASRAGNYDYVYGWFAETLLTRTTAEWMDLFAKADIPFGPMHTLDSLIDDPHLAAVGLLQDMDHPTEGKLRMTTPAATWSRTPASVRTPAPTLGEHGAEILREAGYADEAIAALLPARKKGA